MNGQESPEHTALGTVRARLAHHAIEEAVGMKLGSDYAALVSEAGNHHSGLVQQRPEQQALEAAARSLPSTLPSPVWGRPAAAVAHPVLPRGGYS